MERIAGIGIHRVGFGLIWGMGFAVLFANSLFLGSSNRGADQLNTAFGVGTLITYLLLYVGFGRRKQSVKPLGKTIEKMLILQPVMMFVGLVLAAIPAGGANPLTDTLAGLCIGSSLGLGYYAWLFLYSCHGHEEVRTSLMSAWVVGVVLFILISWLPFPFFPLVLMLISVIACISGIHYARTTELDDELPRAVPDDRRLKAEVWFVFIAVTILGFVYGISGTAFLNSGIGFYLGGQPIINHFASMALSVALMILGMLLVPRTTNRFLLFQIAFTIDVTAAIVLPFAGLWYVNLFNFTVAIVFRIATMLVILFCATMDDHERFRRAAPLLLSSEMVGILLGITFGQNVYSITNDQIMALTAITIAVLYVVFMVSTLLLVTRRNRLALAEDARGGDATRVPPDVREHEAVYTALAGRHGLSERETEILGYLAKGRSATFIADELCLSVNTVKSYMKSLYSKLDVHSKQEVISLVEHMAAEEGGGR